MADVPPEKTNDVDSRLAMLRGAGRITSATPAQPRNLLLLRHGGAEGGGQKKARAIKATAPVRLSVRRAGGLGDPGLRSSSSAVFARLLRPFHRLSTPTPALPPRSDPPGRDQWQALRRLRDATRRHGTSAGPGREGGQGLGLGGRTSSGQVDGCF